MALFADEALPEDFGIKIGEGAEVKKRNVYKDIVSCATILLFFVLCAHMYQNYKKEYKVYQLSIQSGQELDGKDAAELQNISGLVRFEPVSSAMVTLKLEEYTLETTLEGVDLESYPLDWKDAEGTISLGNTAALFFGEGVFQNFSEKHGYHPEKGQIRNWQENYQDLSVDIIDEAGHVKKGRISGILKSPEQMVCMDQAQMEEIFQTSSKIMGGYMEIYGYQNMEQAKHALESGGLVVEE